MLIIITFNSQGYKYILGTNKHFKKLFKQLNVTKQIKFKMLQL